MLRPHRLLLMFSLVAISLHERDHHFTFRR